MKLRTVVLLILALFGFMPLLVEQMLNLPLVFNRLEVFYHQAHLQNLRADFRDLDQHLASRQESARFLARLPEVTELLARQPRVTDHLINHRQTEWINSLVRDRYDIVEVLYLDAGGSVRLALDRDPVTLDLVPGRGEVALPNESLVEAASQAPPGAVLTGRVVLDAKAGAIDPTRFMNLQVVSPVYAPADDQTSVGVLVLFIDVRGIADAYPNSTWVYDNGAYLELAPDTPANANAFADYPGLEAIFRAEKLGLWEGGGDRQVIWVPMLATENSGPLWVGREVDAGPLTAFRQTLTLRVLLIFGGLTLGILLVARWLAMRVERFNNQLTRGVEQVLDSAQPVQFSWRGPKEMTALAQTLSRLSEQQVRNSNALREYARELEENNRYKSEFLANVSHELRTPLNSILLLSKLLSQNDEGRLSVEQTQQARVINKAGTDLSNLINDILDLAKVEAGKLELHVEQVALRPLLEELAQLFAPQVEDKGLAFALQVDDDAVTTIRSDASKLRQILKNFLSNAVKFTAQGTITLRLASAGDVHDGQWPVCFSVADQGIGIAPDKQELVFKAFQQADGSTSRRYGGTGLGLSISRELAALLGGRIELESSVGQGATFSLLLPASLKEHTPDTDLRHEAAQPAEDRQTDVVSVPDADFSARRVLVVDDDLRNLLAMTPILEQWQLEVTAAGTGEEALDTLTSDDAFDIVLLDIMMPGIDGLETLRRIRADPTMAGLPVVALSARAGSEDQEAWLQAGGSAYLVKPLDLAALKNVLTSFLQHDETV